MIKRKSPSVQERKEEEEEGPGDPGHSEFETRLLLFGRGSHEFSLPIENVIDRDSLTQFLSMNNNE